MEVCSMKADEQLVLYQTCLQDIRDLKANQWRFSHYGLLLQVALVAIETTIKTPEWSPFDWVWALCALSMATWLGISWLICEAQGRIVQWRHAIDSLYEPREETMAEWPRKYGSRAQCRPRKRWKADRPFAALFLGVQIMAMVLAIGVMLWGSPTRPA